MDKIGVGLEKGIGNVVQEIVDLGEIVFALNFEPLFVELGALFAGKIKNVILFGIYKAANNVD